MYFYVDFTCQYSFNVEGGSWLDIANEDKAVEERPLL